MRSILIGLLSLLVICASVFATENFLKKTILESAVRSATATSDSWPTATCEQMTLEFICTLNDLTDATGFVPSLQTINTAGTWVAVATIDTINAIGTTYYTVSMDDLTGAATFWGPQFRLVYTEVGTVDSNTTKVNLIRHCDSFSGAQ